MSTDRCPVCFKVVAIGRAHYCEAIKSPCILYTLADENEWRGELNPVTLPVGPPRIDEDDDNDNDGKTIEEEEADDSLLYGW